MGEVLTKKTLHQNITIIDQANVVKALCAIKGQRITKHFFRGLFNFSSIVFRTSVTSTSLRIVLT